MGDVGAALAASGVPRGDLFILQKVGPSLPLGYADTLQQFEDIKAAMNVSYVDALLIHWPYPSASKGNVTNNVTQSSDPLCNTTAVATYDEAGCRLSTCKFGAPRAKKKTSARPKMSPQTRTLTPNPLNAAQKTQGAQCCRSTTRAARAPSACPTTT
jgi:hypothetical protein